MGDWVRRGERMMNLPSAGRGAMLNGCTTTKIFCRPNCPPGRRTKPEHRVSFHSIQEALNTGYRSCRVCKPNHAMPGPWKPKRTVPSSHRRCVKSLH